MRPINIIGILIGMIATTLAVVYYGWLLAIIIFLALYGENLSKTKL